MHFFVALMIFVGVYAVMDFLFKKVPPMSSVSEVLAVVVGILIALFYLGAL